MAATRENVAGVSFSSDRAPEASGFDVWRFHGDGLGNLTRITSDPADELSPAAAPGNTQTAYELVGADREIYATVSGGDPINLTNAPTAERAPDWRARPPVSHLRPKSATRIRASLVTAFSPCATPNRMHGPPLAFASCAPPDAASSNVTAGRPDTPNGAAALLIGTVTFTVAPGLPGPPEDSDVRIAASITDARCHERNLDSYSPPCGPPNNAQQNDYVGELEGVVDVAITDRWNNPAIPGGPDGPTDRATTVAFPWSFSIPCTATPNTLESTGGIRGGDCITNTTFNALVPGTVLDTKRAVWELGQIRIYDAGPDGDVETPDGRELFVVQGVFVP